MLQLVKLAHGVGREEVVVAVARMLGFQATSQQLRERILGQIDLLVRRDHLVEIQDELRVPTSAR